MELLIGVGIGIVVAILGFLAVTGSISGVIKENQTLIAALVAIGAAYAATHKTTLQIEQQYELEAERRQRKNNAARAALSLALSELCHYASSCIEILGVVRERSDGDPDTRFEVGFFRNLPNIPSGLIPVLRDCIESADADAANALAALATALQVQNARLTGRFGNLPPPEPPPTIHSLRVLSHELDEFIVNAADVYARASALLEYARSEPATLRERPTLEEMITALHVCHIVDELFPSMWEIVRRRYPPES